MNQEPVQGIQDDLELFMPYRISQRLELRSSDFWSCIVIIQSFLKKEKNTI